MERMMTQSLPAWSSAASLPAPAPQCHEPEEQEDPALLSGDDTDSDSERGSETLSREDQQLLASFINLRKQRGFTAKPRQPLRIDCTRAAPVLIPTATRRYEPSSRNWTWDDETDDEREHCACSACEHSGPSASTWEAPRAAAASSSSDAGELIFDLEL